MAKGSFKGRVWRFQRSTAGNIVSAMTHNREWVVHFPLDPIWKLNFRERLTFYAEADLVGPPGRHRLRIKRETTEENWK